MNLKAKCIPALLLVGALWLTLAVWCWVRPSQETSLSERRKLAQLPDFTADAVLSASFMSEFETYTLDQFPFRDSFRAVKAATSLYVLGKKDNGGIYLSDGYAVKLEYPLNVSSVTSAVGKFEALYETYMEGKNLKIYLSVVPDKGYFLSQKNGYPAMDYARLFSLMQQNLPFAEYIDISGCLQVTDYYKTDIHWRQEQITDVAQQLLKGMRVGEIDYENYTVVSANTPFYGVYYGQSGLPLKSETIRYLTSETLEACTVYNAETQQVGGIYDLERLNGRDPYEMFLSGACPVLIITNPNAAGRELVVFRDSFASSLIPLLLEKYAKITLVDTRYINSHLIGDYVTFENQDVLFLYSATVLNNSRSLK